MCTLITLWKCNPAAPLILALNRDEFLARPTSPTELWNGAETQERIVAGRDLKSGGTWFGVGRKVVAGLTNHRSAIPSRAGIRSRGDLVVRALQSPSAEAAAEEIRQLPPGEFGDFHLLAADRESMLWITNRSGEFEVAPVAPGVHVLGNYGLDNEKDPVVANLHEAMKGVDTLAEAPLREFLRETLARGGPGWPCVEMGSYGTRSSAILFWGGERELLWTTSGPPNRSIWEERHQLLAELNHSD
jgi:uncharacterized protein with NRDE domain